MRIFMKKNSLLSVLTIVLSLIVRPAICNGQQDSSLELQLINVLKSDANIQAKSDACKKLAIIGTASSVEVLVSMIGEDENLAHMARYALERIPDSSVDQQLRGLLDKVHGRSLAGVIASLGVRKDFAAEAKIITFLTNSDQNVVLAAARALGEIGTESAATALQRFYPGTNVQVQSAFCDGLLRAAEKLSGSGNKKQAIAIWDFLLKENILPYVRTAAARAKIINSEDTDAANLLRGYLKSKDPALFDAAIRAAVELKSPIIGNVLAQALAETPDIVIIQTVGWRKDDAAIPALLNIVLNSGKELNSQAIAALNSLAMMPNAQSAIIKISKEVPMQPPIFETLANMPGIMLDDYVSEMLLSSDTDKLKTAIELAGRRRIKGAMPVLLNLILAKDAKGNKIETIQNLSSRAEFNNLILKQVAVLADQSDLPRIFEVLNNPEAQASSESISSCLRSICEYSKSVDDFVEIAMRPAYQSRPEVKLGIVNAMSAASTPKALNFIQSLLSDPSHEVRMAAIKSLGQWKTSDAIGVLIDSAKQLDKASAAEKAALVQAALSQVGQLEIDPQHKLEFLDRLKDICTLKSEKVQLINIAADIADLKAINFIQQFFEMSDVRNEAFLACCRTAETIMKDQKSKDIASRIIPVIKKITNSATDENIIKRAQAILQAAEKQ
jgi:HEAT repeat protein